MNCYLYRIKTNSSLFKLIQLFISIGEREQLEAELSQLRSELEHSRVRAQHQAALLADSEQDAARKDHLVAVLKQEIGRLERCIQRQPHAKNTEYLKNIVFKVDD